MPATQPQRHLTGATGKEITQAELMAYHKVQDDYLEARRRWMVETAKMVLRMNSGAQQEAGKYALRKRLIHRRHISYKAIVVSLKGQQYVDNLIEQTPQTRSYKLEFADMGPRGVGL